MCTFIEWTAVAIIKYMFTSDTYNISSFLLTSNAGLKRCREHKQTYELGMLTEATTLTYTGLLTPSDPTARSVKRASTKYRTQSLTHCSGYVHLTTALPTDMKSAPL